MEEDDYLNATNLAKLRVAEHVLRDVLVGFGGLASVTKDEQKEVLKTVGSWRAKLERAVDSDKSE